MIYLDAMMNCFNRMFQLIDNKPEPPHQLEKDKTL